MNLPASVYRARLSKRHQAHAVVGREARAQGSAPRARRGDPILFPNRLDECEHERKADAIAKVGGDFRDWDADPARDDAAFEELLRDRQED
jgi:hypothetical protein